MTDLLLVSSVTLGRATSLVVSTLQHKQHVFNVFLPGSGRYELIRDHCPVSLSVMQTGGVVVVAARNTRSGAAVA